jgi:hypothetical protein
MSKCDKGSEEKPLTINPDHGVIYHEQPLLNANDHYPEVNIPLYGKCAIKGKCKPNTADKAWQNVNKKHIIDGAQALMQDSILPCKEGGTISIIMPAEDVNITSKLSEMMTDFVESGIAAATEAQNAKAENAAGSSNMPGMYQGAQVISIYGIKKWLANI